jgi:hypothetical protein
MRFSSKPPQELENRINTGFDTEKPEMPLQYFDYPQTENPSMDVPTAESQPTGNRPQYNINESITEESRINESNIYQSIRSNRPGHTDNDKKTDGIDW